MEGEELKKASKARLAEPSPFACMECGYHFKTVGAAEKAAFGEKGCPKCGGSDIDLALPEKPFAAGPGKPGMRFEVGDVEITTTLHELTPK